MTIPNSVESNLSITSRACELQKHKESLQYLKSLRVRHRSDDIGPQHNFNPIRIIPEALVDS